MGRCRSADGKVFVQEEADRAVLEQLRVDFRFQHDLHDGMVGPREQNDDSGQQHDPDDAERRQHGPARGACAALPRPRRFAG